jgi:hypothetical protein
MTLPLARSHEAVGGQRPTTVPLAVPSLRFSSLHNSYFIGRSPNYPFGTCTVLLSTRTSIIKLIANEIKNGLSCDSPRYPLTRRLPLELSLDSILAVAEGMKQDLQRDANRAVLRNDLNRALGALASINALDDFVYRLKIRSGSQLGLPKAPRPLAKSPLRKHLDEQKKFLRANTLKPKGSA